MKKEILDHQFKYVYYIIALSVGAIAFSVYQTRGEVLNVFHSFLGLAVLCWALGINSGFRFIKQNIKALSLNYNLTEIENTGEDNDLVLNNIKEDIKLYYQRGSGSFFWLESYFYFGILFFLGWHLFNMAFPRIALQYVM